jgi:hypothetical protein
MHSTAAGSNELTCECKQVGIVNRDHNRMGRPITVLWRKPAYESGATVSAVAGGGVFVRNEALWMLDNSYFLDDSYSNLFRFGPCDTS